MSILEDLKKTTERMTGWQRPRPTQLDALLLPGKVTAYRFKDDGMTPNHPRWPLLILRRVVRLPRSLDPAAVFEDIFERNGWKDSWRNGVYDYLHYHSRIHEVMGVARGTAKVRFGGAHGRTIKLGPGDVAILPAGTGHQCIAASRTFLVVGAYPQTGTYDECVPAKADHARDIARVRKVPRPRKDPAFGREGPLFDHWKSTD
jgi:uncharacterized protein YjlB